MITTAKHGELPVVPGESHEETWRPIPGRTGYEASSSGAIRRVGRSVLRDRAHARGYRLVQFSVGGVVSHATVHRCVALAFLGPEHARQVNHNNGDKSDNPISNLEWATAGENTRHAHRTGLAGKAKSTVAT